jgi:hypothetical protein
MTSVSQPSNLVLKFDGFLLGLPMWLKINRFYKTLMPEIQQDPMFIC